MTMTTDEPKITYGLLVGRYQQHGMEYVTVKVVKREGDDKHPLNCSSDYYRNPKVELDGLGISGHVSDYSGHSYVGFDVEYRDVYSVDCRKAERMARTLKRINRQIDKDGAREAGDVMMALAKALKLTFVAVQLGNNDKSWSYADHQWQWMSIIDGRNYYRRLIEDAQAEVRKRKAAVA